MDKLALAGKKKPAAPAKPPAAIKAATAAGPTPAGDLDPPKPPLPLSGLDAVLVLPAAGEDGETASEEEVEQQLSPWSTFEGVRPQLFALPAMADGQTAELVAETLDMVLEVVEEEKAAAIAEKAAAEDEAEHEPLPPLTRSEWVQMVEEKRGKRAEHLPLAARMWKEVGGSERARHVQQLLRRPGRHSNGLHYSVLQHVNGGRQLDLESLESNLLEPWEAATAAYHKEVSRASTRNVAETTNGATCRRLPHTSLFHGPLSSVQ